MFFSEDISNVNMSSTRRKDGNLRIAGMDLVDSILAAAPGVVPENIYYHATERPFPIQRML